MDIENVWAPQMFWYCELIEDRAKLLSSFHQKHDEMWTSVTSYDELICQIFDDLDAENQLVGLSDSGLSAQTKSAIASFVHALNAFDKAHKTLSEDKLETDAWLGVEQAARLVLSAAKSWNADVRAR